MILRRLGMLCGLLVASVLVGPAGAAPTPLLRVDLESGQRRRIDVSAVDRDGSESVASAAFFTTEDLEPVALELQRYLRMARPRALPRVMLFLYPGHITRRHLRGLREILVDIELIIDPCGRSVCRASVGTNLELLGRALKRTTLRASGHLVRFKAVTIRTREDFREGSLHVYRFTAQQVVAAGRRIGGGAALLTDDSGQRAYDSAMAKLIRRKIQRRRVRLERPPAISRTPERVTATIGISSDRVRYRGHVMEALLGAHEALSSSPLTPAAMELTVVAYVRLRRVEEHTFHCPGEPLRLVRDRELSRSDLWASYIREEGGKVGHEGGHEATEGGALPGVDTPDRTEAILTANFDRLIPCVQDEADRDDQFRGLTLRFTVDMDGRVADLGFKAKQVSEPLRACLWTVMQKIQFQKHRQGARIVQFPMYIQR